MDYSLETVLPLLTLVDLFILLLGFFCANDCDRFYLVVLFLSFRHVYVVSPAGPAFSDFLTIFRS